MIEHRFEVKCVVLAVQVKSVTMCREAEGQLCGVRGGRATG